MDFSELIDRLSSVVFPQRCLFCDQVVEYDDFLCGKCAKQYTPFGKLKENTLAAVVYDGKICELIWRIKDNGDKRALRFFAREMHAAIAEHWSGIAFDVVVPVPATASKLKDHGFNHAELLALQLSRRICVPMRTDALIRLESTQMQRSLTAAQRHLNAERSYDIGNPDGILAKTVLLVDDVFTTGSTAAACSGKLRANGACAVYVIAASHRAHNKTSFKLIT